MPLDSPPEFVFLLCSERSGSNLLTRIFGAHSQVCSPAPAHIGSELLARRSRYGLQTPAGAEAFISDLLALLEVRIGAWQRRYTREELAAMLADGSALDLYLGLYRREVEATGKRVTFIKENQLYRWFTALLPVLDRCRFIYLFRDPRDMAFSWKRTPAMRGGVLRAADTWMADQSGFLQLRDWLEATTQRGVPSLAYERLLQEPELALAESCDELGIPFETTMLDFHADAGAVSEVANLAEFHNLARPLLTGNAGKFHTHLSPDAIRHVEWTCAEGMRELGYAPVYPAPEGSECESVRQRLEPQEPWQKPAFNALPEAERRLRQRQYEVLNRIRSRPPQEIS